MERAAVSSFAPRSVLFADGLGERRLAADAAGREASEWLCLRRELASVPSFEFALRERAGRLASFRHPTYARVRSVERLNDPGATLTLVSDHVEGIRLSDLLTRVQERSVPLDVNTALHLIRQLVPAVALLHEAAHDAAHGALGPERIVITPQGRLIVVEHVCGAAIEQLHYAQERYWTELRVAVPRSAGPPRFDQRTDVLQTGMTALALVRGRLVKDEEFPARVGEVLTSTRAVSARGALEPLSPGLRSWLARALQLDPRNAFANAIEARDELDKIIADDDLMASPTSLEVFLAKALAEGRPVEIKAPQPVVETRAVPKADAAAAPMYAAAGFSAREPQEWQQETLQEEAESAPPLWRKPAFIAASVVMIALLAGSAFAARRLFFVPGEAKHTGTLRVTSNPSGAATIVDGQARGTTPLTLTLSAGGHLVELRSAGGAPRSIPVTITEGAQTSQYIELAKTAATLGQLEVRTEPAGADVAVDGIPRGRSPAMVTDLSAGEHSVVVTSDFGTMKQTVSIEAGAAASLVIPLGAPDGAPVSGWISVSAPIDLQVSEQGRLLGSSQTDRIMVAAGHHDFDLTNDALGYHLTRTVQVFPGKTVALKLDAPKGTISLNAAPWAEVSIDGEKIGETPIGNFSLPIGSHEVVFRHPDLGEQHYTVIVTLKEPARLSVDMGKH